VRSDIRFLTEIVYLVDKYYMKTTFQPETIYHIYQRGNNRENIFFEEENHRYFLKLYIRYIVPIAITYAYCLLPNRFHFLIGTRRQTCGFSKKSHVSNPQPSEQFRRLFIAYTKAINKRYGRSGSLFENRFGRKIVDSPHYFQNLVVYIHRNPETHGIMEDFRDWPFSSYEAILSDKPTQVAKTAVLDWFSSPENYKLTHQQAPNRNAIHHLLED
jgi:putative transposase